MKSKFRSRRRKLVRMQQDDPLMWKFQGKEDLALKIVQVDTSVKSGLYTSLKRKRPTPSGNPRQLLPKLKRVQTGFPRTQVEAGEPEERGEDHPRTDGKEPAALSQHLLASIQPDFQAPTKLAPLQLSMLLSIREHDLVQLTNTAKRYKEQQVGQHQRQEAESTTYDHFPNNIPELPDTTKLRLQKEKMLTELSKMQSDMTLAIENGKKVLPLEFLMKYKLRNYCHEAGSESILKVLCRVVTRVQSQVIQRWMYYVVKHRAEQKRIAVAKIQGGFRGRLCRKKKYLKKYCAQKERRAMKILKSVEDTIEARYLAALHIQRFLRGCIGRMRADEWQKEVNAIIRVQNRFRARKCRFAFIVMENLRRYKIRCATKIQAAFRGMKARRVARLVRLEAAHEERERLLNDRERIRTERFVFTGACVIVQKAFRAMQFRRNFKFIGHELATQMQKIVRGFLGRRKAIRVKKQGEYARWVQRHKERLEVSARTIQSAYRAMLSRTIYKQLLNEKETAKRLRLEGKAQKLQLKGRKGRISNFMVTKSRKKKAASTIQRFWRGMAAKRLIFHKRRQFNKYKKQKSARAIQKTFRGHVARKKYRVLVRVHAVTILQKMWRGFSVRNLSRKRQERYSAAVKIQTMTRCRMARKELKQRKYIHDKQVLISKTARSYLARTRFNALVENRRSSNEMSELGQNLLKTALQYEKDRLMLTALHCNPANTDPEESESLKRFNALCNVNESCIGTGAFARLFREAGLVSKTFLSQTDCDIMFVKCCMGKKKMEYLSFVDAMELAAIQLFPQVTTYRKMVQVDAQLVYLLDKYILKGVWGRQLQKRTERKAEKMAIIIQGMYRSWKGRQLTRLARIAREYQSRMKRETTACMVIQNAFRAYSSRQKLFLAIRASYRCFVDTEADTRFWQNPNTGKTSWTKPVILRDTDVDVIVHIPPERHQTLEYCSRCDEKVINAYCEECEDSFCKACNETIHKKGKRAQHVRVTVDRCSLCQFQLATKNCVDCGDLKFCDMCSDYSHKGGTKMRHAITWLMDEEHDVCTVCQSRVGRYDWNGTHCSICIEQVHQYDVSQLEPRKFVPKTVRTILEELHQKKIKDFMISQAQQREDKRIEDLRNKAATVIQTRFRGVSVRKSDVAIAVRQKIQDFRDERTQRREDRKMVNKLKMKMNVNKIQGIVKLDKIKSSAKAVSTKLATKSEANTIQADNGENGDAVIEADPAEGDDSTKQAVEQAEPNDTQGQQPIQEDDYQQQEGRYAHEEYHQQNEEYQHQEEVYQHHEDDYHEHEDEYHQHEEEYHYQESDRQEYGYHEGYHEEYGHDGYTVEPDVQGEEGHNNPEEETFNADQTYGIGGTEAYPEGYLDEEYYAQEEHAYHKENESNEEWTEYVDPASGAPYYYNNITGECVWELPGQTVEAAEEEQPVHEEGNWTEEQYEEYQPDGQYEEYQPNEQYEEYQPNEQHEEYQPNEDNGTYEGQPNETEEWTEYVDPASGAPYYYNNFTGECVWEVPG